MRPLSRIVWKLSLVFSTALLLTGALGFYLDSRVLQTAMPAGVAILLAVALVWLLARRQLDPRVESLIAGMEKLGAGDLGFRLDIRDKDEFSAL
ncbi:MAG: hypothetical protein ACYTDY_08790, partial [Planctomycetota bacterium]